jgi:hypothetical protein
LKNQGYFNLFLAVPVLLWKLRILEEMHAALGRLSVPRKDAGRWIACSAMRKNAFRVERSALPRQRSLANLLPIVCATRGSPSAFLF